MITCFSWSVLHFNSHAHVERDGTDQERLTSHPYFNSHAHVERDDLLSAYKEGGLDFNSHAHVERDESVYDSTDYFGKFQLTRSRGA